MAKKKATSSDVAARAGVSQATVSMVLNRKYNVSFSRETVERVEQAARELGYELPGRRKHKDNRKEKLIIVFCPTLTSPYYVLLLQGIEAVANEQGYGVFICNTQRDAGLEEKYLRMMQTCGRQGHLYLQSSSGFPASGRKDRKRNTAGHHQQQGKNNHGRCYQSGQHSGRKADGQTSS